MGRHVFLSYRHDVPDAAYVEKLASFLTSVEVPVWFDREIVTGDRWDKVIQHQIDTCAAFIVVMTPGADASTWVNREIAQAEDGGKRILPLLLDGKRFFRLADTQYHDVRDGRLPDPAFVDMLRALVTDGTPPASRPLAAPARRPTAPAPSAAVVATAISAPDVPVEIRRPAVGPPARRPARASWRLERRLAPWVSMAVVLAGAGIFAAAAFADDSVLTDALGATAFVLVAAIVVTVRELALRVDAIYVNVGRVEIGVLAAAGAVFAPAMPSRALLANAALAAVVMLVTFFLRPFRYSPILVATLAGSLVAVALALRAVQSAGMAVFASVSPRPWSADLDGYTQRLDVTPRSMIVAALLLIVLAVLDVPGPRRCEAFAGAGATIVLLLPGTGAVDWWAVPALDVVAATVMVLWMLAPDEADNRRTTLRVGLVATLVVHAIATSLARSWLTVSTLVILALVGASIVALRVTQRARIRRFIRSME